MSEESLRKVPFRFALSQLYRAGVTMRNAMYDSKVLTTYTSGLPVVSVGNITVGGNGKSPFVQHVVELLSDAGYSPAILSRGYGGLQHGPHRVGPEDDARHVGDEPLMHFSAFHGRVPVVIARNRSLGAQLIEERRWGDLIVLDDGFQHRALARQFDIVLVDVTGRSLRQALSGAMLPRGTFREAPAAALRRAHALVMITRGNRVTESNAAEADALDLDIPAFRFQLSLTTIRDIYGGGELFPASMGAERVRLFSAIAAPKRFHAMVEERGFKVTDALFLRDHAIVSPGQWEKFFRREKTPVIITSKDAVKIRPFVRSAGEVYVAELAGKFVGPGASDAFTEQLFRFIPPAPSTPAEARLAGGMW